MYLKRLEDFTPKIALKALKNHMTATDRQHIKLSTKELNRIEHGISDDNMVKYVVSIGDGLYQIVAVDSRKLSNKPVAVVVDYFQLAGTRRYEKEYSMQLKDFTPKIALEYLKECISEMDSRRARLNVRKFNLIQHGICDNNMIKYVVSTGYGLYQIVAIKAGNANFISVVVTYSQI